MMNSEQFNANSRSGFPDQFLVARFTDELSVNLQHIEYEYAGDNAQAFILHHLDLMTQTLVDQAETNQQREMVLDFQQALAGSFNLAWDLHQQSRAIQN